MKKHYLLVLSLLMTITISDNVIAQGTVPEILYYKFDQTGTSVQNEASAPPAGTSTGTLMGGMTQGGTGLCGSGLVGTGGSSSSDYVSTGWNTNLGSGAWTISFWTNNIPSSSILFYQFGDPSAGSFRCFTNGAAGAGNFMLRGPITDVTCVGCAPVNTPSMTTFVYDPVAGTISAYHDGVLNTVVSQPVLNITGANFTVGGYSSNTGLASGQILDEFRIYDRALTAQEVFDTYNACLPLFQSPDDVGVASIDEPVNFCPGTQDVVATIRNYGTNQVDTCIVQWTIDGVPQTPYYFSGLLDTVGGTGSTTAQVTLGSATFNAGTLYDIEAWTEFPNLVADTVNGNDTSFLSVQPSLSGNFTIGGVAPDYPDFSSAVSDLVSYGVCGPVVFDVRAGTYNEQVELGNINGASETNTITFRSEDLHRDSVILTFSSLISTDNYTLRFNGANYVNWEKMTVQATGSSYSHVVEFEGNSENIKIIDCLLDGITASSTSTYYAVVYSPSGTVNNNISFINNTISGGSYGLYYYGGNSTSLEKGLVFEGNECIDAYYTAARFYYQDSVKLANNTFLKGDVYTGLGYGLYAGYVNGYSKIVNNHIYLKKRGYGLYLSSSDGIASMPSRLHNNTVVVEDSTSTSASYGIYLSGSDNWKVMNNSVNLISASTTSRAIYVSATGIELYNNIFRNDGPGYGIYHSSGLTASNNNNFYVPNGNVGYYSGAQATLADWQAASYFDDHSVSGDPGFFSSSDLHTCNDSLLDGAGIVDTTILIDMDGQLRDTNGFDIGADEFIGLSNFGFDEDTILKCSQDLVVLGGWEPQDGATYLWSTTDTTSTINAAAGSYDVTVTTGCGTAMASVVVDDIPDAVAGFTTGSNFVTGIFTNTSTGNINSYLWDFGDGTTSTEESPLHIYNSTGTFTVTLTVTGPCGTDTYTEDITLEVAGLDEDELGEALTVYPNPNNGEFELLINLDNASNVNAELLDARGQIVWNSTIGNVNGTVSKSINIEGNATGIYFLKVTTEERSSVRKVVVNK